jgi:glycine betaine catabolism B
MSDKGSESRLGSPLWDAPPSKWNPDADEILVCCQVRRETHDVKSFLFRTRTPKLFRFRPGQFITLELTIDGQAINRCYTISSPPTQPDTLSITVKRKPGGVVSNWLHDNVKAGSEIKVLGPAGDFSCTYHPSDKYLFLSGGSGVTPVMSMTRTHYALGEDRDIVFVHSARAPRDIIFRRELEMISHAMPRFRSAFVCENNGGDAAWTSPVGQLTLPLLTALAPDFSAREIFCCGPEPYMAAIKTMLKDARFDMTHYHEESFSFELHEGSVIGNATQDQSAETATGTFRIEFTRSGQTIDCGADQFILDAARAAGMRLPFSCAKGLCGTCKSKKLSGEVLMTHGGGIRQREIDQGLFLPCCSKPLSNVVIEK